MGSRLVDALARDLHPVRPVRTGRLVASCLALCAGITVSVAAAWGLRADVAARLAEPAYLVLLAALALSSAACIAAAVRSGVPGRYHWTPATWLLLDVPFALAGFVLLAAPWGARWPGWSAFVGGCIACTVRTALSAALPFLSTVVLLRRLAPLRPLASGLLAGAAALFAGAIVTNLHCAVGDAYHLAFAHYVPVVLLACLAAVAAVRPLSSATTSR